MVKPGITNQSPFVWYILKFKSKAARSEHLSALARARSITTLYERSFTSKFPLCSKVDVYDKMISTSHITEYLGAGGRELYTAFKNMSLIRGGGIGPADLAIARPNIQNYNPQSLVMLSECS